MLVFAVSLRRKESKVGRCMCTRSPCGKSSVKKPGWNLNLVDESMNEMYEVFWMFQLLWWLTCLCACKVAKKNVVLDNFS